MSLSLDDLKRRLRYSGDSNSKIKKILLKSNEDLANLEPELYEKTIIMDDLEKGLDEIIQFIRKNLIIKD